MHDPLQRPARPEDLGALARSGRLSEAAVARGLELAVGSPEGAAWRVFLERALLLLGTALVLSGVVFFFAYNWQDLHPFAKFGLLGGAILASFLAAWLRGLEGLSGQVALTATAVLVGALLAVYGQVYQTGADAYSLFLAWALLVTPWVLAARFPLLWLLLLALIDTALALYWSQVLEPGAWPRALFWLGLSALQGSAWLAGEVLRRRGVGWLAERWPLRLLALATLFCLTVPGVLTAADWRRAGGWDWLALVLLAVVLVLLLRRSSDLLVLTASLGSGVAVLTALAGNLLFDELDLESSGFLLLALVLLAELAAAARWLRRAVRRQEAADGP